MKITLEIPDESVCMSIILGLQGEHGWGMATVPIEDPGKLHDGAWIEVQAGLNKEKTE